MYSKTERDLINKVVLVLYDSWVSTKTTGMQNGDEDLPGIILVEVF